jgi:hypothetical protein
MTIRNVIKGLTVLVGMMGVWMGVAEGWEVS